MDRKFFHYAHKIIHELVMSEKWLSIKEIRCLERIKFRVKGYEKKLILREKIGESNKNIGSSLPRESFWEAIIGE